MVVAAAHAVGEGGVVHVASGFGVAGASGVGFVDVGSVGPAVVFILILSGCAVVIAVIGAQTGSGIGASAGSGYGEDVNFLLQVGENGEDIRCKGCVHGC